MEVQKFRRLVWAHYRKHGRHELLWRETRDPYRILVSEVMLQQTQVERVLPYYREFLKRFPIARRLAEAPLSEVLKTWQGLGYNRRAKMLHEAAKAIAIHGLPTPPFSSRSNLEENGGEEVVRKLEELPGVGPYTARAVATFALDADVVFVETNIRTAITHHFFPGEEKVSDKEIAKILHTVLPKGKAREWYYALMDYGSFLKRSGVRINARSSHYTKQSRFSGSNREARGAILKELAKGPQTNARLLGLLGDDRRDQLAAALGKLKAEGFIKREKAQWLLA